MGVCFFSHTAWMGRCLYRILGEVVVFVGVLLCSELCDNFPIAIASIPYFGCAGVESQLVRF